MSFWGGMWTLTPVFCRRAAHVMYHDTITIYTYIWIYSCYKVFCIWSLLCEKFVFNSFYDVKNEVVLTIVKIEFIKERKIILLLIFWKKLYLSRKNDKSINYLIQWKTSKLSFEYQLINVFINDTFVILREIHLVYILFRIIGKEFWPIKWYHITSGSTTWRPPLT